MPQVPASRLLGVSGAASGFRSVPVELLVAAIRLSGNSLSSVQIVEGGVVQKLDSTCASNSQTGTERGACGRPCSSTLSFSLGRKRSP